MNTEKASSTVQISVDYEDSSMRELGAVAGATMS